MPGVAHGNKKIELKKLFKKKNLLAYVTPQAHMVPSKNVNQFSSAVCPAIAKLT